MKDTSLVTLYFSIVDEEMVFTGSDSAKSEWLRLGMRIICERAELLGGNFHVKSAPGKGTTISVAMPLENITCL